MRRSRIVGKTSTSTRRHAIVLLLATIVALGALWFYFRARGGQFHWDQFLSTVRTLNPYWMLSALILVALTYVGRALRWQVLMRPVKPHAGLCSILVSTVIGFAAIVLFGRPGEVVRPYLIAAKEKVTFSSQLAAWLLERIYDLLIVLLISGYALTQLQSGAANFSPALQWVLRMGGYIIAGVGFACLVLLVGMRQFSGSVQERLLSSLTFLPDAYQKKLEQLIKAFASGMESTRTHSFVVLLVFYTLLEWLIIAAAQYCLFKASSSTYHLGWTASLTFVGFVAFGSIVQIPGVGGGTQVAAILVLTEFFGLGLETATGLAIAFWFTTYVTALPAGLWLAVHEGIKIGSLRHIEENT